MTPIYFAFGGGVNSSALCPWMRDNKPKEWERLHLIFADTGGELPETYQHIERFEKWLKENGQKLIKVGRPDSLENYCLDSKSVPMRQWKWCTDKWKIRPIDKWADDNLGMPRIKILGIASDEAHRAKPNPKQGIENWYPLVDAGITRKACGDILKAEGLWPVAKSGCFFCPLAPNQSFVALKENHPDLFDRAVAMEDNAGTPLKHKRLRDLVGLKDKQSELWVDLMRECDSGHCFT